MTLLDRLHRAEKFLGMELSPKTLTTKEIQLLLKDMRKRYKIII
jgi:hypothetical protein